MPDPKTCKAKGLVPGTDEYKKCISYQGQYANKGGNAAKSPVSGSLKKGGY